MITTPDGKTMVVGPDGKPLPNGGKAQPAGQAASPAAPTKPAEVPAGINPETGEKYTSVADAPLQLPPGAEPEAGMTVAGDKSKPAGGQAASPAKPAAKPAFKVDPVGQSIANQLKMTTPDAIKLFQKNNGLTPDGQIGPQTTKALQAAAKKMGLTTTSGVGTSTAGAGRGGQGGPTATQMAQAPAAGGQAASPAAPAAPAADAPTPSLINRFRASRGLPTSEEVSAPTRQESIRSQDDEILARIKSAFRF
jgi:peptidoglycan hydrolase-like protein with peptidoglycan-binding domain